MKLFKYIFIGLALLAVAYLIYFASQFSATYAPLKSFELPMNSSELHKRLTKIIASDSSWDLHVTDTTGDESNRKTIHANMDFEEGSEKLSYQIKLDEDGTAKSVISVIGVFDRQRNTGGYKVEDADVERLLRLFENRIISKLQEGAIR